MDVAHTESNVPKRADEHRLRLQVWSKDVLVMRSIEQPQQPNYLWSTVV